MGTAPDGVLTAIAARYRGFAELEARGQSALYADLAIAAAQSPDVLEFLVTLPEERRQPNLFLAAIRSVAGAPPRPANLGSLLREHGAAVREVMLTRRTQTNEPARCAVLLPALAQLPQPLALLEVGASAGLCLLPDCYAYDYGGRTVEPALNAPDDAPRFHCRANADTPLPHHALSVAWRRGLDLNPIDLERDDDRAWLETLVWPDQPDRLMRLTQAMAIARRVKPPVTAGNLLTDLERAAAEAPPGATLVIYHTAVLAYIRDRADRDRFAKTVRSLNAVWICNESPNVYSRLTAAAPSPPQPGAFLLSVDGRPVAWTAPHGQWIHWFGS